MADAARHPVGILLAAGRGTRYDPTERTLKLLAPASRGPHRGAPLAAAAAQTLLAELPRVTAVVRVADRDEQRRLHAVLRSVGCALAVCHDADLGMSASLACGIRAEAHAAGWLIALGDMPAIAPATVRAVVAALRDGAQTVVPVYRGQPGHPVGFAAELREELLALAGDSGARAVLQAHPPLRIDVDDSGVLYDVDLAEEA
jgi:molybdenum cofactor cytidylyltransferase